MNKDFAGLNGFIWWMGDDTIEPGGVAEVLNIIKTEPTVGFLKRYSNTSSGGSNICGLPVEGTFIIFTVFSTVVKWVKYNI